MGNMNIDAQNRLLDIASNLQGVEAIMYCISLALEGESMITEPYLAMGTRLIGDIVEDNRREIEALVNGGAEHAEAS